MAKRGVTKTSTGSVAFSASSTAPTPRLSSSANKRRREASLERNWVEIDLNSSGEDLPAADEVIAAKVPRFGAGRTCSGPSTGFGSAATKKSQNVSLGGGLLWFGFFCCIWVGWRKMVTVLALSSHFLPRQVWTGSLAIGHY